MHLHKGKEYFDQSELQKAREELEAALEMRPQDEKVLNMLGMTYFKLEMLPEAEDMYVSLAARNPDIYTLQSNLGLIQLKLEKLDRAKESLTRALALQPTNPKAHFYLGLLYEKKQDWQEALDHFERARADKMVAKIRARLEEEANKRELLPFQVLEVLAEAEASAQEIYAEKPVATAQPLADEEPFELPPPPESEEEAFAERLLAEESTEPTETTMKISNQHLEEAVQKSEQEISMEGPQSMTQITAEEIMQYVKSRQTRELFEDPTVEVIETVESPRIEEPVESVPEVFLQESTTPADSEELLPPPDNPTPVDSAVNGSFFLMEEMAADISTFLAQSRNEELDEEEGAVEEQPQMSIFNRTNPEENPEELFESRLPTPDEVENQTQDIGTEMLFEKAEAPAPVTVQEETQTSEIEEEPRIESESFMVLRVGTLEEPEQIEEAQQIEDSQQKEEIVEETAIEQPVFTTSFFPPVEESGPELIAEVPLEPSPLTQASEPATEAMPAQTAESFAPANLDQFSRERFYVQPLIGSDRFLLIDPHLLEIIISEKMICRLGTISSYTGNLQFSSWESEYGETIPLIQVTGSGIIFLADRAKEIFVISLNNETIFAEANHLLVAQPALTIEAMLFISKSPARPVPVVKITGRGTIALTCQTKPLTLKVNENLPVNIHSDALIAWSGPLYTELIQDEAVKKVLMASDEKTNFLRFIGNGDIVVEQGSLWGDRRLNK